MKVKVLAVLLIFTTVAFGAFKNTHGKKVKSSNSGSGNSGSGNSDSENPYIGNWDLACDKDGDFYYKGSFDISEQRNTILFAVYKDEFCLELFAFYNASVAYKLTGEYDAIEGDDW
jgi:hypothetical protein